MVGGNLDAPLGLGGADLINADFPVEPVFLDPDLVSERFEPRGQDLDRISVPLLCLAWLAQFIIIPLDIGRFHWSGPMPGWLYGVFFVVQGLVWLGFSWAMRVKRYFSSAIRMREDRGQQVITAWPYHWSRHPGYAFVVLAFVAQGFTMGSWWSLLPSLAIIVILVRRTLLEEKCCLNTYPDMRIMQRTSGIDGFPVFGEARPQQFFITGFHAVKRDL